MIKEIFDRLTGSETRISEMYSAVFSETETRQLVQKTKKQNKMIAVLILLISVVVIGSAAAGDPGSKVSELDVRRPGIGDLPKTIETDVSAEYDGYTVRKRASLRILPREPSYEEAEALIKETCRRLPDVILGDNPSLNNVTKDLYLPLMDRSTGAEISWRSSDQRIISNEGIVNLVGIEQGTAVALTAHIRLDSAYETLYIGVVTGQDFPAESINSALNERLDEAISEISNGRDGETMSLLKETPDGVKLSWSPPEDQNGTAALFALGIGVFFCFTQRFRQVTLYIEKARFEMERDYPDFVQKLGLLLGAGMVITSAIKRITDDYLNTRDLYGRKRLYEEIAAASDRMRSSGTSLVYEFSDLARRSGLRDLMRFSSTLSDNIDKGSTLVDKLRAENELLWEGRKKRAEKEGRIAETKLIFPMVLQILAVIAITVMPATFEMGQI